MTSESQNVMSRYKFVFTLIEDLKKLLHDISIEDVEQKEHEKDLVTNVDKEVNNFIIEAISNLYDDTIIGEENSKKGNNKNIWYIDPIDGTTNFLYRKRDYAISIAFEGEKEKFGFVYDVKDDVLYHAEISSGAFIDNKPFKRPETPAYGILHITPNYLKEEKYERYAELFQGLRYLEVCSIEIIRVAIGEASSFYRKSQNEWDYKAAVIFAKMVGVPVVITENNTVHVGTPFEA